MNSSPFLPSAAAATGPARSRINALHDAGLIRRFNTGDEAAFTEIATRHRDALVQIAQALLHNRADAEEMAQDALIRAYRGLARFRGESSLATWLHCIVRNLSLNRYWYFFRRHRHLMDSFDRPCGPEGRMTLTDLVASDAPSPVHEATSREFSQLVTECMGQLNPTHREVLELRNVRRQPYGQIAGALGITTGTVKSRIARARENLRALMLKAYDAPAHRSAASETPWFETSRHPGRLNGAGV